MIPATAGRMRGDCVATLGQSYALAEAAIIAPTSTPAEKLLHGTNQWAAEGDVTAGAQGIFLNGSAGPAWASPELWSGLKNAVITAKMRVESASENASFGLKFGYTWAICAAGPRLVLTRDAAYFPAPGDAAAGKAKARIPLGEWFTVAAEYLYDEEIFEASLDGVPILRVAMPQRPFDDFMKKFGRPAPVTGLGVFADGCALRVAEFSFLAGAPRRRIAAFGDSVTQRAYWVEELEKALGEKIANLGIGGDQARLGLLRFDHDVVSLRPEICVLFQGSNDMWDQSPQEVAFGSIQPMVRKCREAGIRPVVCEILPRRGYANVPAFNAEIRRMAAAERAPLLAWHDATLDPATCEMKPGFAPDGSHPVQFGAEAMVRAIDLTVLR